MVEGVGKVFRRAYDVGRKSIVKKAFLGFSTYFGFGYWTTALGEWLSYDVRLFIIVISSFTALTPCRNMVGSYIGYIKNTYFK